MEFLSNDSVQRLLVVVGVVLGLFVAYLALAMASNRTVRRLAETLRHRRSGRTPEVVLRSSGRWSLAAVSLVLLALIGLLVFFSRVA